LWWFRKPNALPQSAYYRPLHNLWLAVHFHLFGLNPVGWHLMKVLLHVGAVALCFRLAQLLTQDVSAALATALLFGLMPLHAQPMASINALGEERSATFELGALCVLIHAKGKPWHGLSGALALFAAALLSHESTVTFPLAIGAYVLLLERHQEGRTQPVPRQMPPLARRWLAAMLWSVPFSALALAYIGVRAMVLKGSQILASPLDRVTLVAVNGGRQIDVRVTADGLGRLLTTLPATLVRYLEMLAFPWLAGPTQNIKFVTTLDWRAFYQPAAILLLLAVLGWVGLRNSPRRNLYLFCFAWWLVALAPALNLNGLAGVVMLGNPNPPLVQDRYLYLGHSASAGWPATGQRGLRVLRPSTWPPCPPPQSC
jgi:hypothetical protein